MLSNPSQTRLLAGVGQGGVGRCMRGGGVKFVVEVWGWGCGGGGSVVLSRSCFAKHGEVSQHKFP